MFVVSRRSKPTPRAPHHGVILSHVVALLFASVPLVASAADPATVVPMTRKLAVPVVTSQPQSAVVLAGQPATFVVAASSSSAITYQWTRNGVTIAGASAANYVVPAAAVNDSGASFTVTMKNAGGSVTSSVARLTVNAITARVATSDRPFSDQSPWNARPSRFTLGTNGVPKSDFYPNVAEGSYSLGVFVAAVTDPAMTVYGASDAGGIFVPDAESDTAPVVIAHWPAHVVPAPGSDGHADIVDPANNRIHSFWQLRLDNGKWRAGAYSWTALDGRGFGTPAQYMQGARAAGVPSMAGLIRKSEVNDGQPSYKHALVMSMAYNGLARDPTFTFPATAADYDAASTNSGTIPEGTRMMIPASFDTSVIKDPRLLKIVKTLQSYGANVVDRNWGTPYLIYVEIGSGFNLMPTGWDGEVAAELDMIRAALRPVASVTEWVDAKGVVFTPASRLNLLSMRGYWWMQQGTAAGMFDTQQQAVVFPNNGTFTRQINTTGRSMPTVSTTAMAGKSVTLKVVAAGGAQMKLELASRGTAVLSTGFLGNGATVTFIWPADGLVPYVSAQSGAAGGGTVSATLVMAP